MEADQEGDRQVTWLIVGSSKWGTEVIDTAESKEEADKMVAEYKQAFGHGWSIRAVRSYA